MQTKTLTPTEAAAVIRWYAAEFREQAPISYDDTAFVSLVRKLSYLIDADVDRGDVEDIVHGFYELAAVERGSHIDLEANAAGTMGTPQNLLQRVNEFLEADIWWAVNHAGIRAPGMRAAQRLALAA